MSQLAYLKRNLTLLELEPDHDWSRCFQSITYRNDVNPVHLARQQSREIDLDQYPIAKEVARQLAKIKDVRLLQRLVSPYVHCLKTDRNDLHAWTKTGDGGGCVSDIATIPIIAPDKDAALVQFKTFLCGPKHGWKKQIRRGIQLKLWKDGPCYDEEFARSYTGPLTVPRSWQQQHETATTTARRRRHRRRQSGETWTPQFSSMETSGGTGSD